MSGMLSLLDALPRHERVDIGSDQKLDVFGVSGEDIGRILERYPDAFQQISVSGSQPSAMHPGLLGALLAASSRIKVSNGSGEVWGPDSLLNNETAELRGRSLGVADQAKVMQAIGRCTFPDGVGPFLEDLVSMSSSTTAAMEIVVRVASKEAPTTSPQTPKPSAQPDTPASGS